ncbi:TRAP transporter substrate-binding protein [Psychromonas sp. 14N.309.X.WAT.B.A12]|uniref:TRAP transporter substrate-binding protein n=1 Tax=unclassified Psychromonas TaxID=2614957 RepID=UPI0025B21156|nr:TRAP transporter substrate-binding protein [Psychromonas sp. 14N.309.X.WAT.B.A12]MDN2662822.1 TRAP transporter substrate-binding protein [Psychromonas sp. 14N.309.X.WAT.B.A12]
MLKSLYKKTLVAAVVMVTSVNVFAADKVYRLKLAESWGPNFPVFGDSVKNMVKMAEEMSNGRLKIRVDSANKHKSAFGVFDMVKSGQYDMGHSASYYYKGKVPNTLYFTTMPFGMTAMEQYAWFQYGGGQELMDEVYADHNLVAFPGGNTGVQMGGWFRKEINNLDDLKNLKMRIPGFAGEVLAKLGATPVNIPPGELYTALERNTIDALEWVGPSLDLRMGFHKIAPFYYMGWHEPATELMFIINKKKLDSLPADLQAILKVAMHKASYDMYVQSYASSAENWAEMTSEFPDIKVKTFPPEVLAAMKKANDEILAEKAASDEMAAKIIKSQQDYLKLVRVWTDISEFGYIQSTKE